MLQALTMQVAVPETKRSDLMQAGVPDMIVWEHLKCSGGLLSAHRAKIPGGWLVYVGDGYHHHGGVTFYPDPGHIWTGESM